MCLAHAQAGAMATIPIHRCGQSLAERNARLVAQPAHPGDVRASPQRASCPQLARNYADFASEAASDGVRKIGDARFSDCSNVVDAQVLALIQYAHHAIDEIADVHKGASLTSRSLNRKVDHGIAARLRGECLHSRYKLGDHMFGSHVGAVHIVRAEYHGAVEKLAAVIDEQQFADDLAPAIGIPRIEHIGHTQRHSFGRGDQRRGLIYLRTGGQYEFADAVFHTRVENVDHPFDRHLENQVRLGVEKLGAVYVGEVANAISATYRVLDRTKIANIAGKKFDRTRSITQFANSPARIVVEDAHTVTRRDQTPHQGAADKTGSTGNHIGLHRG